MKISFITDEVTQSFDEAVRFARQNGLAGLELRSVEDTAIDMLPAETLRTWRRRLDAEGLTVCGLAGSFYKCAPEPDAVEAELECFSPAFTVLSYGEGNTYGHPAPEAVERLEQTGTEIWRTADSGAVNVWTDGKRMYIKGYKKQDYGEERDKNR